jgi:hypothetical protein
VTREQFQVCDYRRRGRHFSISSRTRFTTVLKESEARVRSADPWTSADVTVSGSSVMPTLRAVAARR